MGGIMKVGNKTVYSDLGPPVKQVQPRPTSTSTTSVNPTVGMAQYQPAEIKEPAPIPKQHRIEAIASKIPFVDAIASKIKERRTKEAEIMKE
jgi:hypothetical protein